MEKESTGKGDRDRDSINAVFRVWKFMQWRSGKWPEGPTKIDPPEWLREQVKLACIAVLDDYIPRQKSLMISMMITDKWMNEVTKKPE